jgi:hypothetical protein
MVSMTVPERISEFLAQRGERMYCDTCIQERLGLKWRQQVQLITATLAVTAAFKREFNRCCTCEEIKQVTYAVNVASPSSPSSPVAAKLRVNHWQRHQRPAAHFSSARSGGTDFIAKARSSSAPGSSREPG